MNNLFQLYPEPLIFSQLITWFGAMSYGLTFLVLLYTFRITYYAKTTQVLTHKSIWLIVFWLCLFNYNYGWYLSIGSVSTLYFLNVFFSYKWIEVKSLKWINISMLLLIWIMLISYNLFNTKIHEITYPFFLSNDIFHYDFTYKPYFQIYHPEHNDLLGQISFTTDGKTFEIKNMPIENRIYCFYYVLNTIGLFIWLMIYQDVLKKHSLFLGKEVKENTEKQNFFFNKLSKKASVFQMLKKD